MTLTFSVAVQKEIYVGEHSENISKCLGKVSAILSLSKLRSDERIDEERHIYGCYGRHKLLYV